MQESLHVIITDFNCTVFLFYSYDKDGLLLPLAKAP